MNTRSQAAQLLFEVLHKRTGSHALNITTEPFAKHLFYGTVRHYESLRHIIQQLLHRPLKDKDQIIFALLLILAYQLIYDTAPEYAAINEAVEACKELGRPWATGLVNKIGRELIAQRETLIASTQQEANTVYNHPFWLLKLIKRSWPEQWQEILATNMRPAPLDLRVNLLRISREDYLSLLQEQNIAAAALDNVSTGVRLVAAIPADAIPGLKEGLCSVQDLAGQLAVDKLPLAAGMTVLDACAAPGSKTCHLLERSNNEIQLIALDKSSKRLTMLEQNLERNGVTAQTAAKDALEFAKSYQQQFDFILLDAPCSALGVIRRHPEIKLLRSKQQIAELIGQQQELLTALWPLIKPGGHMLYSTCSILPVENSEQIKAFLAANSDAQLVSYPIANAIDTGFGQQLLPSVNNDGFFYALIVKK